MNDNAEIENSATIANSDSAHLTPSSKTGLNLAGNCEAEHSNVTENDASVNASNNHQNENSNWFENCETSNLSQNETSQPAPENPFSIQNILAPNQPATSSEENAATSSRMSQIFIKRDVDELVFCRTDADGCPL